MALEREIIAAPGSDKPHGAEGATLPYPQRLCLADVLAVRRERG
jgi:hypothetical protein